MTKHDLTGKFAPTPLHGAAYGVAIAAVGGLHEIGSCGSTARYAELRAKLDALIVFAKETGVAAILDAYEYGVARVDADLRSRLAIIQNSERVRDALANIPKPEGLDG